MTAAPLLASAAGEQPRRVVHAVDAGKVREELSCGCAFLFDPLPQRPKFVQRPTWRKSKVRSCAAHPIGSGSRGETVGAVPAEAVAS